MSGNSFIQILVIIFAYHIMRVVGKARGIVISDQGSVISDHYATFDALRYRFSGQWSEVSGH